MLVLDQERDQSTMIGDELEVTVGEIRGDRVLLVVSRKTTDRGVSTWRQSDRKWLRADEKMQLDQDIICDVIRIRGYKACLGIHSAPHRQFAPQWVIRMQTMWSGVAARQSAAEGHAFA